MWLHSGPAGTETDKTRPPTIRGVSASFSPSRLCNLSHHWFSHSAATGAWVVRDAAWKRVVSRGLAHDFHWPGSEVRAYAGLGPMKEIRLHKKPAAVRRRVRCSRIPTSWSIKPSSTMGLLVESVSEGEQARASQTRTTANNAHGKRLIPHIIDQKASQEPQKECFQIACSSLPEDGWRTITFGQFANAINKCCHHIVARCGRPARDTFPTIAYIGPNDARYLVSV